MISLETIMEEVSSLGPGWDWLIRSNGKRFVVNVYRDRGEASAQYFPVHGTDIATAFTESLRRARAFLSEGVR